VPTNEEGEFELILGNRQLLSVFFIVVILLGLFFAMGYFVGLHSTPLVTADSSASRASAKPSVAEPEPTRSTPEPASPPASEPAPSRTTTTAPQQPAETPKSAEPAPRSPSAEPAKSAKSVSEPTASASGGSEKGEKERPSNAGLSGTYLQLAATTRREADIMVDVLRQKKFAALTAEVPEKPGLFRVLVGPMPENQVNKTKTDLQNAGFPGNIAIKRSF